MVGKSIASKKTERRFGLLKGRIKVAIDFDVRLLDDLLGEFEGKMRSLNEYPFYLKGKRMPVIPESIN